MESHRAVVSPVQTAALRDLLPGITEKVLAAQLRELEKDGVIARKPTHDSPPKVTYSLTKARRDLIPLMEEMRGWGRKHLGIPPNLPLLARLARRSA